MNKENLDKLNTYFKSKELNYKDFEVYFKNKDYNTVYEKLIVLTWKLAHTIARERMKSNTSGYYDGESEIVKELFNSKKNDLGFYDLYDALTKWHERIEIPDFYDDGESCYLFRQKQIVEYICDLYNYTLDKLKLYCIKAQDYCGLEADEIINIAKDNAIKLFKKMLDAIDEKYDENVIFKKWLDVMESKYTYFSKQFRKMKYFYSNRKYLDPIIVNMEIEENCEILDDEYEFYIESKIKGFDTEKSDENKEDEEMDFNDVDFEEIEEDAFQDDLDFLPDVEYDDYEPESREFYEVFIDDIVDSNGDYK